MHVYEVLGRNDPIMSGQWRESNKFCNPPIPNGKISSSVRLACAIQYFAGGSPYDLMAKYGVSDSKVFTGVWAVVEAVNKLEEFHIKYPHEYSKQKEIAAEFEAVSGVGFNNCPSAIDAVLIWMDKPDEEDARKCGLSWKKVFCARKNKFGLKMQAVSDCHG